MTTEVKEEKKLEKKPEKKEPIWSSEERERCRVEYGCELLIENGSTEEINTKKAPTDSYIVKYIYKDNVCRDLTRGTKTTVFDMYYDKFKSGIQSISYSNGTIKPNLWGYKSPQQKKKRK